LYEGSQLLRGLTRSRPDDSRGRDKGAAITVTRGDHTAAELRSIAGKSGDGAQVRRLLALAMVLEGSPRTEAAQQNGMDRQTLRDWIHRYNQTGVTGLKSRSAPGPKPVLTEAQMAEAQMAEAQMAEAQMAELKRWVLDGPDPAIHTVVRWRCVDLRAEVKRRFEVTVHESTIGKWLHQLKMTRLQPRPQHPQKDPEAEAAFKKTSSPW
jgi:transposase